MNPLNIPGGYSLLECVCWYKAVNLVGDTLALRLIEEHILLHWPVLIKFSDGHDMD